MKVIFDKKVERMCMYCVRAKVMRQSDIVICSKKGVMGKTSRCGAFSYDALKRRPKSMMFEHDFNENDFSITEENLHE